MHELGIAESILAAVRAEVARHHARRAVKVGLRVGPLAGVDRASLEFCFSAVVKESEYEPLALDFADGSADELEFSYMELETDE